MHGTENVKFIFSIQRDFKRLRFRYYITIHSTDRNLNRNTLHYIINP